MNLAATLGTHLDGKVVLVTGGARGVGRGISEAFLASGCRVVVCGRNEPDTLPTIGENTATFVTADVRDPDAVDRLIGEIVNRFGGIDVAVNNAGGSPPADAATASPRFAEGIMRLNLLAPLLVAQRSNLEMQRQPSGGGIVNIASVSGVRPSPGTAAYGAAKAGLLHLTTSLAIEWAPKVRVNAVIGGLIRTEQSHLHYGDEDGIAAVASTVPLGRLGEPSDVGEACVFLASDLARYVTGAAITVHGGGERPAFLAQANAPPPAPR